MRILLIMAASAISLPAQSPAIFVDARIPQMRFVTSEAGKTFRHLPLSAWQGASCKPCFQVLIKPGSAAPQSYFLSRTGDRFSVTSPDANGAMYGALDLLEAHKLKNLNELKDGEHTPHIVRRGIKFNIPLDARTPSYSDPADAAQANIAEVWSIDFWHSFLDEMARDRYNVLSLWSLHPFPSMVRVPEFPDVALADVKRTTHPFDDSYSSRGNEYVRPEILANLETIKTLTIDEKIQFWRSVMQYAKDRGIDTYLFTWNIFTYGATGKYGITDKQDNPITVKYFRASVRETVLAYPLLAGIGITAGEQMDDRLTGDFSAERWLYRTYGEGIRDALGAQPSRAFNLIHRYHETKQSDVLDAWKDYGAFDFSYKYSVAHMYSIAQPHFIDPVLASMPPGMKTWLTIRNDDVYSFRWGDPEYARAYISAIPGPDKIAGFYMGPDGYTWGREFLSKNPSSPHELVMSKQWYSFMMWGRLSYDPSLPPAFFTSTLASRFPGTDALALHRAWAAASQVFPLITRFFWGDIDLKWFPEASLSHPRHHGYYTVRDFMEGSAMPGSGVLSIREWRAGASGISPLTIADSLAVSAASALGALPALRMQASVELRNTLGDIESMSQLATYYAFKIRGAAALASFDRSADAADRARAVAFLSQAAAAWRLYAASYSAQYTSPHLYNRVGFVDIPGLVVKVDADIDIARGWKPGTLR